MTSSFKVEIASLSDIHVGHPKNDASFIINNLYKAFPNNPQTGKLDFIFIAGDFFDRALMLTNDAVQAIDEYIIYMLNICKKYDITLIVLEGTPSHDRHQPRRFVFLNEATGIKANLIYVDELSIRYVDKLGDVLFVPDECRPTTEQILADTMELMRQQEITQVDYAIMHGTFDFQVPEVAKCPKHNSATYMSMVKKLIFIGHDHTRANKGNIFAHGSFDRICHGDEIPKGHYRATVRGDNDYDITFVENKDARTFKTIDVCGLDLEGTNARIASEVANLRALSHVRVKANKGHPILGSLSQLEKDYPLLYWTKLEVDDAEPESVREKIELDYVAVQITKDNIVPLFLAKAINDENADDRIITLAERRLAALK